MLDLERDLDAQRLMLNRLLGLPAHTQVRLRAGTFGSGPNAPAAADLEKGLEDRRLDLLACGAGMTARRRPFGRLCCRVSPTPPSAPPTRDTAGVYTFGYDLSVDLPLFDRNQGNIAIETATRRKLLDEFVNRVFEARSDVATSVAEIESLQRQIAFAQSAVPVLERLVADYGKAVEAGNADVLSYYSARNDLNKKKIEILRLQQELVDAWIGLENASGMYLTKPDSAAVPASQPAAQGVMP